MGNGLNASDNELTPPFCVDTDDWHFIFIDSKNNFFMHKLIYNLTKEKSQLLFGENLISSRNREEMRIKKKLKTEVKAEVKAEVKEGKPMIVSVSFGLSLSFNLYF